MKLTFLGTRGEIEARTRHHARHTVTEVAYRGTRILLDAGRDWLGKLEPLRPRAIVLTHAHADHVGGLRAGAPCPVWATGPTASALSKWPIDLRVVRPRHPFRIGSISLEAFEVEHSLLAPAVGYRVTAGTVTVFYVADVLDIPEREAALAGCRVYIGDGATIVRPLVRTRGDRRIGHASVKTQLAWCEREHVPRAIITHCGSGIVAGDPRLVRARIQSLAAEAGIRVEVARDGMVVVVR